MGSHSHPIDSGTNYIEDYIEDYMKRVILLIVISIAFLSPVLACAAIVDCAASCTNAALTTAISSAGVNGTVNVPAGTHTWTGAVTITRGVKIVGAGVGSSIINQNGQMFNWSPSSTARTNAEVLEVSGFTINNTLNVFTLNGPDPTSNTPPAPTLVNLHDMTINSSENSVGTDTLLYVGGDVFGTIWGNTINNNQQLIKWLGDGGTAVTCSGYYHWLYEWGTDRMTLGNDKALYIENNVITPSSSSSDSSWTETGQGAPGLVVRYNTWNLVNRSAGTGVGSVWDVHGLQYGCDAGQCASLKGEYYGNFILNVPASAYIRLQDWRGSHGFQFNNRITGTVSSMQASDIYAFSSGEPCCDSGDSCSSLLPGRVQDVNNYYVWNNKNTSTQFTAELYRNDCSTNENSAFFNYSGTCTSSACSSGVGVGSATPSGTCTTGVGYWKWANGTTLPTDMATMISATQAGTFYKCTSTNNWQVYYTPYIYPHPLQGGGAPATPTNFSGVLSGGVIR